MAFRSTVLCSLVVAFLTSTALAFQDGEPMRFETPKMNEEEQHSQHTPKSFAMTCDFCTAIAFQVIEFENFLTALQVRFSTHEINLRSLTLAEPLKYLLICTIGYKCISSKPGHCLSSNELP